MRRIPARSTRETPGSRFQRGRLKPMHLALNFQRVDPARGGAETYVADLCRYLVQAGHRVDLYAESWADGCLPPQVNVVPVAAPGRTKLERIWNFARNSEAALRQAQSRLLGRLHQHLGSRRDHPPGRRSPGQPDGQRPALLVAACAQLYLLAKTANPKHWVHRVDRAQAVRARPTRRGWSRSATWSSGISRSFITFRASRSTSCPTRSIPSGSRCRSRARSAAPSATDSGWSPATWSVCSSATTSRSRG